MLNRNQRTAWAVTLAAAAFLMVTMGARQSLGLFVSPINTSTGLGITAISLAMAVSQLMWGVIQPVAGAMADRHGPARVLVGGLIVLAIGTAMTPFMTSTFGLVVSLGFLVAIGSGAGSFSVLIGAAAQRLPAEGRGKATGIINAGGSFGQFVFAPISQGLIGLVGWMGAMWSLAAITLAALPLAKVVSPKAPAHPAKATGDHATPWRAVRSAMALLSHQVGGFLGAYLGGIALVQSGSYEWIWYADMALAAAAAIVNLPIREARVAPAAAPA